MATNRTGWTATLYTVVTHLYCVSRQIYVNKLTQSKMHIFFPPGVFTDVIKYDPTDVLDFDNPDVYYYIMLVLHEEVGVRNLISHIYVESSLAQLFLNIHPLECFLYGMTLQCDYSSHPEETC